MSLMPFDPRGLKLKRSLRGYDRDEVHRLLEGLATRHEDLLRNYADLRGEVERLEEELSRYQDEEGAIAKVFLVAQRTAEGIRARAEEESEELTARARRDSEAMLEGARAEVDETVRAARSERDRLQAEVDRLRELEARVEDESEERARVVGDAEATLETARTEAEEIVGAAESESDRIEAEIRRLREFEAELRATYHALLEEAFTRRSTEPASDRALGPPTRAEASATPPELPPPSPSAGHELELPPPPVDDAPDPADANEMWSIVAAPARPVRSRARRPATAALIVAVGGAIVVGLGLIVWVASSRNLPLIGGREGSATPQGLTSSNVGLPGGAEAAGAETTPPAAGGSTSPAAAGTTSPAAGQAVGPSRVLLAAGDIATCGPGTGDELTAEILGKYPKATIAALGDNAYPSGTIEEFEQCYDPSWGQYKARIRPATGNHEYRVTKDAAGYSTYFGERGGPVDLYYYSYDLGTWHVVVLNSDCWRVGGCRKQDPQVQWLLDDLAEHPAPCTLAYFHRTPFSSGRYGDIGNTARVRPIWEALYENGADVVLAAHEHSYERFVPMDASGERDEANGIRLFVVGTGGGDLREYVNPPLPTTAVRQDHTWGVLKLTLDARRYEWEFLPAAGEPFTDSGSGRCH